MQNNRLRIVRIYHRSLFYSFSAPRQGEALASQASSEHIHLQRAKPRQQLNLQTPSATLVPLTSGDKYRTTTTSSLPRNRFVVNALFCFKSAIIERRQKPRCNKLNGSARGTKKEKLPKRYALIMQVPLTGGGFRGWVIHYSARGTKKEKFSRTSLVPPSRIELLSKV